MATTETQARLTVSDVTVVDVDSHVGTGGYENLLPYFKEEYSGVKELIKFSNHPSSEISSAFRASPAWFQTLRHDTYDEKSVHQDFFETTTVENKLDMMDEYGIDYSVLGTGPARLATVNHDPTAVAIANAYNSWVLDNLADIDERVQATIVVPPQKPKAGAEEIERVADEDGIVGVQLPGVGLIPPAGHPWYDPIYEAAEDAGLPILMHSGNGAAWPVFPVQRYWAETFVEDHAFTFAVEPMWHLMSMIFRGLPERFPGLDYVFQESGAEWVGWAMGRLDEHYLMSSQDVPMLTQTPSEYILDHFYFGTQPIGHHRRNQYAAQLFEIAGGADTVMFSTDHPHPDFDPPEDVLNSIQGTLDEETTRGIMGGAAMDVFDL